MRRFNIWAVLRIVLGVVVVAVVGLAAVVWATVPSAPEGHIRVPAKTPFTSGPYFAYSQPWGGEMTPLTKLWAPRADHIVVDLKKFPNDTQFYWRWPPFGPTNGPGVWAYSAVMHGNYDGGEPDVAVPPKRVRDVRAFSQAFAWTIENGRGDGNVLSEVYLRSSETDPDAKVLEIGWFLHMPQSSRTWFENARPVGVFVAPDGMRWAVRIEDKFCMFGPERAQDIRTGTLDMLAALAWLRANKTITGDEWLWGISLGVEPVKGVGHLSVDRWSVARQ